MRVLSLVCSVPRFERVRWLMGGLQTHAARMVKAAGCTTSNSTYMCKHKQQAEDTVMLIMMSTGSSSSVHVACVLPFLYLVASSWVGLLCSARTEHIHKLMA